MKKLFCMFLILTLILLVPLSTSAMAAAQPPVNYLVLGDSIAAGTDNLCIQTALNGILDKYPSITLKNYLMFMSEIILLQANPNLYIKGNSFRYTYQFRDYLARNGAAVNMTDWSVPGYTSEQLLKQIQVMSVVDKAKLKNAQYITISIGGNDILAAGADYGFSKIDTAILTANVAAYKTNLANTLDLIEQNNPKAKILLLNFFNLYNSLEMSTDGQNLSKQVDSLLKPNIGCNNLGDWLLSLPAKYPNVRIADTYGLFGKVSAGATQIATAGTYAAKFVDQPYKLSPAKAFPRRFITKSSIKVVSSPYALWNGYTTEWKSMIKHGGIVGFVPKTDAVAFDVYSQFYNPNNYVFGYDAASSQIYKKVQSKCNAVAWTLIKPTLDKYIGVYAKWRDVHCTLLGQSLIAKANIDALSK